MSLSIFLGRASDVQRVEIQATDRADRQVRLHQGVQGGPRQLRRPRGRRRLLLLLLRGDVAQAEDVPAPGRGQDADHGRVLSGPSILCQRQG